MKTADLDSSHPVAGSTSSSPPPREQDQEQQQQPPGMERDTICFPHYGTRSVLQRGDPDFPSALNTLYPPAESDALESLIRLKTRLRTLDVDDFWTALTEGISQILGAEMSFVFKRMLVDDHEVAVEMPPLGAPGSCMMATAFHYCARDRSSRQNIKQTQFYAYGCPCAYMRHDKVFVIPDRLNEFITDNPNKLPTPAEAYIAVPLFSADGKCFAHFGVLWSAESAACRNLSWSFIEMLLHSLEDMVLQVLLQGSNFLRPSAAGDAAVRNRIIPHDAVTVAQSLRPYAGSLSHELRTPMQGIVGMLDVMYATVREAVETQGDPKLRSIFASLKESIEVVQDSSRRAVEAADNVVHAYDMDMSVPDAPSTHLGFHDADSASPHPSMTATADRRPEILVAGYDLPLARSNKRRRDEAFVRHNSDSKSSSKFPRIEGAAASWSHRSQPSLEVIEGVYEAEEVQAQVQPGATTDDLPTAEDADLAAGAVHPPHRIIAPGLRHTNMREIFRFVIDEGLKVGGRPDQFVATETANGESILIRSRGSDGSTKTKTINWRVDPSVPHSMFIDEKDLSKLVSCVFRNAIKFADQDGGRVGIDARMSARSRCISIIVSDNGPGIPAAFLPKLFKAFSRDDHSITRQSEGLGLGLMVAKGLARKLGGDLLCTHSRTSGPDRGSEFEIKVPVLAGEIITRPSSPISSPRIGQPTPAALDIPQSSPMPPAYLLSSPPKPTRDRKGSTQDEPLSCASLFHSPPSPESPPNSSRPNGSGSISATAAPTPRSPRRPDTTLSRPRIRKSVSNPEIDRDLAAKYPLTFLVAEDNKINRKLLVSMLRKFGYTDIHEAHDGAEAVRQMAVPRPDRERIDVILMDLWMPLMDGYEATERILGTGRNAGNAGSGSGTHIDHDEPTSPLTTSVPFSLASTTVHPQPTVLAVSADCTDGALERAAQVGMRGFMTKPYKLHDLQRLITEYCASKSVAVG